MAQTAIMTSLRTQADGSVHAASLHGFDDDPSEFPFSWRDASAEAANATMLSPERAEAVDRLARDAEERAFHRYVQENESTAGFPLYHHTPQVRDGILLSKYFSNFGEDASLEGSVGANLISPWVKTLTASYIAQVLVISTTEAQDILDRAAYLKDQLEPAVQADVDWQNQHGTRGQRSGGEDTGGGR